MIVDPWGKVVAEAGGVEEWKGEPEITVGEVDMVRKISQLPRFILVLESQVICLEQMSHPNPETCFINEACMP